MQRILLLLKIGMALNGRSFEISDITMCSGVGCRMADSCYRFTAPVNRLRQSFFAVVPVQDAGTRFERCREWVNNGSKRATLTSKVGSGTMDVRLDDEKH
jgi:hypothetical protein